MFVFISLNVEGGLARVVLEYVGINSEEGKENSLSKLIDGLKVLLE